MRCTIFCAAYARELCGEQEADEAFERLLGYLVAHRSAAARVARAQAGFRSSCRARP